MDGNLPLFATAVGPADQSKILTLMTMVGERRRSKRKVAKMMTGGVEF